MPAISTMLYPIPAYVRVEVNWADVGAATSAAVYRVDCLTGERVPLRPYVSYDGDFIDLSCGYAIFWDTEPQLDRCVYYCTQAQNAAGDLVTQPADPLMFDTFTRNVAAGSWGTATSGQPYTVISGTAADVSVNGSFGRIQTTAAGQRRTVVTSPVGVNLLVEGTIFPTVSAAGGIIDQGLAVQYSNTVDTGYEALVRFNPGGQMDVRVNRVNSGSATVLSTVTNIDTFGSSSVTMRIKFQAWGNQIRMKAWQLATPEPADWQISITDPAPLTQVGGVGGVIRIQAGNSNVPFTASWDNITASDPCGELVPIENCSQDLVVPSSGDFRLGDPVRPCNDVVLLFGGQIDPDCVPTQGIFFANMDDEGYPANSNALTPVNDPYPIVVNRARGSVVSSLTTVTRTFADRDAMLNVLAPGSPLLLRGPAAYGIPDRYMAIGDAEVGRHLSDHKIEPRSVTMPHVAVRRPSAPTAGVCGTRVEDLCDTYASWDAMRAAGLTYADLLRGKASPSTPLPDTVERTWADVNSTYANWTAVNAGNTDWDDLRDGA